MILGLLGYAGSGKSVAARILSLNHGFTQLPFAGPLKEMLRSIGLTEAQLYGDQKEVHCDLLCGQTPRHAMVTLGTEWRDMIGRELWSKIWEHRLIGCDNVVAEDCRFSHEVEAIKRAGGEIWIIDRGLHRTTTHASEGFEEWVDPDTPRLSNRGSEADLADIINLQLEKTC